jgi:NADH-quinone oxidoreductase chain G
MHNMKNISFKLNDFQYTINNKLTLIQACLKNKVDIPRFCFHEKLSIAGNCRMCLVEDLKQVKPLASCAINVSNSMNIYTNTLKVKKARESVLEFLLANHPLDCPICDQGGECDLQDQSLVFGSDRGRFYEFKRSVEDKDCGPLIKTIMNRCIHRTRCVRFSNEIAGVSILGTTGRGSNMEIGFYIENLMASELSGNVIDLCPVGALTSKPFAFTSRPWELRSHNSIDILDPLHSNIRVDIRGTKIMRVLPRVNNNINEDWITDKIRFCYDSFRRQRLHDPMVKINNALLKTSWKKSLLFIKSYFYNTLVNKSSFVPLRGFLGDYIDLETAYIFKKFLSLNGSGFFVNAGSNSADHSLLYSFNTPLSKLQDSDICVLVDVNLRMEMPLINSRIRQLVTKKMLPVFVLGFHSNFNFFVKHVSSSSKALLQVLEGSHWLSSKLYKKFSIKPLFFVNESSSILQLMPFSSLLSYTNVFSGDWNGLNVISWSPSYFSSREFNFVGNHIQNHKSFCFSFDLILNFDRDLVRSNGFKIYQGHHGDLNAPISNVILPATSFVEKNSFYASSSAIVQKTKKALFNPGNSRDDWKILNALSTVFGFGSLNIKSSLDLVSIISQTSPFVLYKRGSSFLNFKTAPPNLAYYHFFPYFSINNNYYQYDSISRNSKIMSLCFNKFKTKSYNFI